MNLESSIKDIIKKKLEDGVIEQQIEQQLEKGIKSALDDLFGNYGDVTKIIKNQIKSVMVPYLESYDYTEYITKLDTVLVDVLKHTAVDNKNLLENFQELMVPEEFKSIQATELFSRWKKFVAGNVETDDLEINYEEGRPAYESVSVFMDVDHQEDRSWSNMKNARIVFECEHDESMNFAINIHRWDNIDKKDEWSIDYTSIHDLNSLRNLNEFEIFIMKLQRNYTKLILDKQYSSDEIVPEAEPETCGC